VLWNKTVADNRSDPPRLIPLTVLRPNKVRLVMPKVPRGHRPVRKRVRRVAQTPIVARVPASVARKARRVRKATSKTRVWPVGRVTHVHKTAG
jgi:hypothetical protein